MHQGLHSPTVDSPAAGWSKLLELAKRQGASDIHLEKAYNRNTLSWRESGSWRSLNPGILGDIPRSALWLQRQAGMHADGSSGPQDGVWHWQSQDGGLLYIRVSLLPLRDGFSLVLRLLRPEFLRNLAGKVCIPESISTAWKTAFAGMPGLHLFTGPTGSGKTTSLFTLLDSMELKHLKVMTAEDPVEYYLDGAVQLPIQPMAGFGFAQALRSFLRQDPDVVIVGEIRDEETAQAVVAAAVTGLKIIATLHCEGTTQATDRLLDLGVKKMLIDSALRSALSQRRIGASFEFDLWVEEM